MKRNSLFLMMQAVVLLCSSLVMSSCDEIFATEDNPVTSYLQIYEKAVTLKVGDTYTRTAFAASDAIIEYSSSDVAVATVDQSGLVTAVGAGTALITVRATGYATDGRKIYIEDSKSYEVTVTGGGAAPSTNSYRVYTSGTDYTDESIPAGASAVETSAAAVTWPAGTYVVSSDASIGGNITLSGDVNLILCDGKELTVSGTINGGTAAFNIYGQASGTGKLTIDGGNTNQYNIVVKDLQIHGGVITGTNSDQAIETNNTLKIYHGNINVTADATGFMALGDLSIYGGTITASSTNGYAVSVYNAAMEMTGGSLTATSSNATGINVTNDITIYGGTINATGGDNAGGDGGSGIVSNNGDITISGSANVTAIGGNGGTAPYQGGHGIHAGADGKTITISGGTVIATAGDATSCGGYALFTYNGTSGSINITGGNVTATAAGTDGVGINSKTIEIDGSRTVVNSTGAMEAMFASNSITFKFNAGTVTCESTDNNSNAIESSQINYYGGTITATGGPSGKGFDGTLWNKSGAAVDFGRKANSGDAWTAETVDNNAAAISFDRYMFLQKP